MNYELCIMNYFVSLHRELYCLTIITKKNYEKDENCYPGALRRFSNDGL